jgi:hypothetical protein
MSMFGVPPLAGPGAGCHGSAYSQTRASCARLNTLHPPTTPSHHPPIPHSNSTRHSSFIITTVRLRKMLMSIWNYNRRGFVIR